MRRTLVASLFFAAPVGAWQAMVMSGRWSPVLLPSPGDVGEYLWTSLADGSLLEATAVTMRRLLVGYAIGLAIGLPLGLLSSASQFVEDTVGVLALGLHERTSITGCNLDASHTGPMLEKLWAPVASQLGIAVVPTAGHWLAEENAVGTTAALLSFFAAAHQELNRCASSTCW